jgi:hypothetical protein
MTSSTSLMRAIITIVSLLELWYTLPGYQTHELGHAFVDALFLDFSVLLIPPVTYVCVILCLETNQHTGPHMQSMEPQPP